MPASWRVHVLREGVREAGIRAEVIERDIMVLEGAQRQAVLDVMIREDVDPPMVLVDDEVICAGEIDVQAVVAAAQRAVRRSNARKGDSMADVTIVRSHTPEPLDRIVELHAAYYAEHWGFGSHFEAQVASGLAEFLHRYDPTRDGVWLATVDGRIEGAIAIDGVRAHAEGAHLRWFIVSESMQGRGIGGELLQVAMGFCRDRAYTRVYLWTFAGLDAARHLYEREGFVLAEEKRGTQWGTEVLEQKWECSIAQTIGA